MYMLYLYTMEVNLQFPLESPRMLVKNELPWLGVQFSGRAYA
jgi:hypothetical protein